MSLLPPWSGSRRDRQRARAEPAAASHLFVVRRAIVGRTIAGRIVRRVRHVGVIVLNVIVRTQIVRHGGIPAARLIVIVVHDRLLNRTAATAQETATAEARLIPEP